MTCTVGNRIRKAVCCAMVALFSMVVYAQTDSICYRVGLEGYTSSGEFLPFWLQTNRYGAVSARPHSANLSAKIEKGLSSPQRWFDYGFGLEAIGQADADGVRAFVQEAYVKVRLSVFDFTVGIKPDTWGNQDPDLSSGGFLFSKNARPMPRITVGIEDFAAVPFTWGYLEIKGGLTHAWFTDNVYVTNALLHHKFLGGRIGGRLPVNISYEFHHVAQWGGISPVYGDLGHSFGDFWAIFRAKSGGIMSNDQINALGNHIGSQQMALEVKFDRWKIHAYWQTLFEDGPIRFMWRSMNWPDGVWGIAFEQSWTPFVSKVIYEYINTTDQSGPFHDLDGLVFGGADSYFYNTIYRNGWNHYYRTIGTPFITSPVYNAGGETYTLNNRAQVHYVGLMGDVFSYKYKLMASYARNYGTYSVPSRSENTAIMLNVEKHFSKLWGLDFGLSIGADFGTQFGNSFGCAICVAKRGLIWKY